MRTVCECVGHRRFRSAPLRKSHTSVLSKSDLRAFSHLQFVSSGPDQWRSRQESAGLSVPPPLAWFDFTLEKNAHRNQSLSTKSHVGAVASLTKGHKSRGEWRAPAASPRHRGSSFGPHTRQRHLGRVAPWKEATSREPSGFVSCREDVRDRGRIVFLPQTSLGDVP